MGDPLADLNPAQREAVRHGDGPLMVLAGAGSGKTRVITRRIAWLLDQGVSPDSILALTFTNKAAGEMAQRVQALGGHRVRVATFHSACARFLRVDGHLLGYPRAFSIYDTYDRDVCIKQLLVEHGVTQGGGVTPSKVGSRISRLKNLGVGPADFISGLGEVDAAVRRVYAPYLDRMRDLGAMDFDDLLLRMCDLLAEHPAAAEVYQERFRYLLVDEFQDTNVVQYRLVRLLTGKHQNVCVVGDPDQSIYRFRGAELRNILDFENDYPAAALIRLETNYRSTGCILAAAQGLIENNRDRLPKTLRTDAEFGAPIKVVRTGSDREEADEVAGAIAELLRHGVGPEQVAVFYRTHFLSRAVEQAFRQRGIGYDVVGGLTFFERREIK
ncbi:MAG: UvrD-helicase domain-containing protein, partial [Planctomycetes bacterium]|nr:UvrD-helicase domain-containing protein [Planctomycetota bacterium]